MNAPRWPQRTGRGPPCRCAAAAAAACLVELKGVRVGLREAGDARGHTPHERVLPAVRVQAPAVGGGAHVADRLLEAARLVEARHRRGALRGRGARGRRGRCACGARLRRGRAREARAAGLRGARLEALCAQLKEAVCLLLTEQIVEGDHPRVGREHLRRVGAVGSDRLAEDLRRPRRRAARRSGSCPARGGARPCREDAQARGCARSPCPSRPVRASDARKGRARTWRALRGGARAQARSAQGRLGLRAPGVRGGSRIALCARRARSTVGRAAA